MAPEPEPEPEERAPRAKSIAAVLAPPVGDAQQNDVEPPAPLLRETTRKPDGVRVVQHVNGEFLVERVREDGGSYAGVFYTRVELAALVAFASEVLR